MLYEVRLSFSPFTSLSRQIRRCSRAHTLGFINGSGPDAFEDPDFGKHCSISVGVAPLSSGNDARGCVYGKGQEREPLRLLCSGTMMRWPPPLRSGCVEGFFTPCSTMREDRGRKNRAEERQHYAQLLALFLNFFSSFAGFSSTSVCSRGRLYFHGTANDPFRRYSPYGFLQLHSNILFPKICKNFLRRYETMDIIRKLFSNLYYRKE